jgi:hypothetical protein
MNLTTSPHDPQIGISLNKSEQDTLQQTVTIAENNLHQLHQVEVMVAAGRTTIDPEQVEALRNLATALLTGARGVIATSNRQTPVITLSPLVPTDTPPVLRATYTFDLGGRYTGPVLRLGQRTTLTDL